MKKPSKSQIAKEYREKHPEKFHRGSQLLNAFKGTPGDGVSTAPVTDHKAPELRSDLQHAPAAAPNLVAPSLPPTEGNEEYKTLTLPLEDQERIKSQILIEIEQQLSEIKEKEQEEKPKDDAGVEKQEEEEIAQHTVPLSVSANEEEVELQPLYSSDKDEVKCAAEATVTKPGLIASLPLPPTLVHRPSQEQQQQQHPLEEAVELMKVEVKHPARIASPLKNAVSQITGIKRRNAPHHLSSGGGSGAGVGNPSKPPLKLMRADEYVAKPVTREPAKNLNIPGINSILDNANAVAVGIQKFSNPIEDLLAPPGASPPKKPSCLADAVTAAQMVAHTLGEDLMKPNQYSLRPLPPTAPVIVAAAAPPPLIDLPPASGTGPSEEYPSLNAPTQQISLHASGSDGNKNGVTQMGESEPQEVTVGGAVAAATAVAAVVATRPEVGVRFAQDLLFNRKNPQQQYNNLGVVSEVIRPPTIPVPAAAPQLEQPAPLPPPADAANIVFLQNADMSTPLEAIQNPLPTSTTALTAQNRAPAAEDQQQQEEALPASNTRPTTTKPPPDSAAALVTAARTPFSTTRPGTRQATTSPAPVDLDRYLSGSLLDAMIKHGGVPPQIYQWQAECLTADGGQVLESDRNLVYSAPTSAGKTLVAEILLLRALARYPGRKTMLVLPYRALCHEKATRLAPLLKPLNKEVREYHGGLYSANVHEHTTGIIVATIENANSILNRHLEEGSTPIQDEFSCIVTDELHLLGDSGRGYLLELLLTKLRYQAKLTEMKLNALAAAKAAEEADGAAPASVSNKQKMQQQQQQQQGGEGEQCPATGGSSGGNVTSPNADTPFRTVSTTTGTTSGLISRRIQIIGMSATLPNINQIGKWLDAAVYVSEHRPVPLTQYFKLGRDMLTLPPPAPPAAEEADRVAEIPQQDGERVGAPAPAPAPLVTARQLPPATSNDPDHVAYLTRETVDDGHSVLIFCAYKKACLWEAKRLAKLINVPVRSKPMAGNNEDTAAAPGAADVDKSIIELTNSDGEEEDDDDFLPVFEYTREAVAEALEALPLLQSKEHAALVRQGIAYHNSDLTKEEKRLIEGAYRSGAISVLCATSTLAAGVNLPARRVIFLHAYKARDSTPENFLTVMEYHQMAGRAGRAGIDEFGESILIHSTKSKVPKSHFEHLIRSDPERIESCLASNSAMMMHAMLEAVSSGTATTAKEVFLYVNSFLLASDADAETRKKLIDATKEALKELGTHQGPKSEDEDRRLVVWEKEKERYVATDFGKAAMYSGLPPEMAIAVMVDLAKARKSFVMDSELYSCYVCVPVHADFTMNPEHWRHLKSIVDGIQERKKPDRIQQQRFGGGQRETETQEEIEDPADWKAAKNIGVLDFYYYIFKKAQEGNRHSAAPTSAKDIKIEHVLRKFYIACMLQQLVSERSKEDVAKEFHIYSASFIETLQENTCLFASKSREFCKNVHWFQLAAVLDEFGTRIKHGAKRDILALSKIKGVKPPTARLLFQAGLRNVEEVAASDKKKIMKALGKGNAYQNMSKKEAEARIRAKADQILTSAKQLLKGAVGVGKVGLELFVGIASPESDVGGGGGRHGGADTGKNGTGGSKPGGGKRKNDDGENMAAPKSKRADTSRKAPPRAEHAEPQEKEKEKEKEHVNLGGHTEEWEALDAANQAAAAAARLAAPPAQPLLPPSAVAAPPPPLPPPPAAAAAGANVQTNADKSNTRNEQQQQQQPEEQAPPPSPPPGNPHPNNNSAGGGNDGSSKPSGVNNSDTKSLPSGLFLINDLKRLDRFIRILSTFDIFAAQFIVIPPKRAFAELAAAATAQIMHTAAMAPPLKIKKKEGNDDRKKPAGASTSKPTIYDDDLDSGDPKAKASTGPKPGTVIGIAISWAPGAAAYIPLNNASLSVEGKDWDETAAGKIADVILASEVEVVWFGWKNQVEATRWLLSKASFSSLSSSQKNNTTSAAAGKLAAAGAGGDGAGTSADAAAAGRVSPKEIEEGREVKKKVQVSRTGADLHKYMTDARIAMWLCQPDSATVQDGILTEDDINSSLITSEGKRKRGEIARIFGAEVLLKSLSGDPKLVARALHGLTEVDKRPISRQALHACQTAAIALELRHVAMKKLTDYNDPALLDAFRRYEMPLVPVLADMERAGAGFSIEKLNKMLPRMKRRLGELHTLAHDAAGPGPEFTMTSPADIRNVLYQRLQLPVPHGAELNGTSKKDGTSYTTYSTGKRALLLLMDAHPIVPMIMEHRKLTHTIGRVRDMIELAKAERDLERKNGEPNKAGAAVGGHNGGKSEKAEKLTHGVAVHCPFIHTGTATGRLAMEGFNLQNLTKPYAFKALPSQKGDATTTTTHGASGSKAAAAALLVDNGNEQDLTQGGTHMNLEANLRSAIVPSKTGRIILGADFRQIEFRLMAHFSGDSVVRTMLADGAEDPFKLVAARWRKLPLEQVTTKLRDDAKQIVYALFYGMGAGAMADKLEVSPKRAQQMKDEFLDTYSGIKQWIEQVKIDCCEKGYITTLAGRRRWIPEIRHETDWKARASGERKAVNSICQGSAADVAKKAMIDICRQFDLQNLRKHADMVLQIHDELVFEVDIEYQDQVAKIVKECMENVAKLDIPLRAKLEIGPSWGEMSRLC